MTFPHKIHPEKIYIFFHLLSSLRKQYGAGLIEKNICEHIILADEMKQRHFPGNPQHPSTFINDVMKLIKQYKK
jgi:hypothetical protein